MRVRSIVMTVLAGVSAIAVPAAAMEMAGPDRPRVALTPAASAAAEPAAAERATTVPSAAEPAAAETATTVPSAAEPAAAEPAGAETAPTTAATAPPKEAVEQDEARKPVGDLRPVGEKQTLRLACVAGKPDGAPAVRCQWSPAEGADHYVLFRKTADGQPERIYSGLETSFVDRTASEGTGYGYGVKAIAPGGRVIGASEIVRVHCCGDSLPRPQMLRLACVAGKPDGAPAVRCQWSPAEGADHYVLFRKTADGQPERIYSGLETSFVDRTASEGTGYGYGVKAIAPGGRVIGASEIVRVQCCPTGAE